MGYELTKLMEHYGLTTPNMISENSNFNPTEYNLYKDEYTKRLANTPMYGSAYSGTPLTLSGGYEKPVQTTATTSNTATPTVSYLPTGGVSLSTGEVYSSPQDAWQTGKIDVYTLPVTDTSNNVSNSTNISTPTNTSTYVAPTSTSSILKAPNGTLVMPDGEVFNTIDEIADMYGSDYYNYPISSYASSGPQRDFLSINNFKNGGYVKFADGGLNNIPKGNELTKLLNHYGLPSATISNYSGTTDTDNGAYNSYVQAYKDRVKNTPMYGSAASDRLAFPTYSPAASTATPSASVALPVVPSTPSASSTNAGVPMINNTLTNASPTMFQGPTPLFSGIWGSSPYSSFGGWGMGRAKGGSIDTAAEKNKLAKKYGFGGTVEGNSVDPITLNYYNPQPDPMAEIPMVISAGQGKAPTSGLDELDYFYNQDPYTSEQESDDYPNQADMLSSKAQVPAMYQLNESGQPVISEQPVAPQVPDQPDLGQLSAKYSEMSPYAAQIAESRKIAKAESDAFTKMIQGQLTSPEQNNLSKAEMYFRLAAAFGSPTRTKQGFMENLGAAGQQLAEYSKGARSDEAAKNALRLEAQKLRMQTAKEDLTTLRTLAAEEMKDKRALDLELLKEKIKADQPLSAEGKAAYDIGLRKGTPEFSQKVEDFVNAKNEARAAGVLVQQGNLDVNRAKLAKENKDLSSTELQLKQQTESLINSSSDALNMVERALKLNDEARITSGVSGIKHTVLSYVNADDPTTKATNELLNLLKSKTYSNLKATFGGQLSDGERKALEGVSGSEAKSPEERKRILINAAAALRNARERSKKQLDAISSGSYGEKIEKTK